MHYHIEGTLRGRIDRCFHKASGTFRTPNLALEDCLYTGWFSVDLVIPQDEATRPTSALRPTHPRPIPHSEGNRYPALILRSSRTDALGWATPAGSPIFKIFAGANEANILQQLQENESHMLLMAV